MKANRTFASKCLSAILTFALVAMTMNIGGCHSELRNSIQTAEVVTKSAGNILSASNPQAGALLIQASSSLKELDALIGQYDAAVAAGKPGIASQIQAVTATLTVNLSDILATVRIKNPELIEYITVAVAIANSVVQIVLQHLPVAAAQSASHVQAMAQSQALPTVQFSGHKDLKAQWNGKVSSAFPKAKI